MPPGLEFPFKFIYIIPDYLLNFSGQGFFITFPNNCCYSRLYPQLRNTYGAECTTVTIVISMNKGNEGLCPMGRACRLVNRIWFTCNQDKNKMLAGPDITTWPRGSAPPQRDQNVLM